jgi:drug/metabolite transporter (DMT)-like permease
VIYLQLAGAVLLWAANWPLLKLGIADASPLAFSALRFSGALAATAVLVRLLGSPLLPLEGERFGLAVVGLLQMGLLLVASVVGLQYVPAGRAAVLMYTMQLWALPLGWLIAGDRLTPGRLAGGGLAFAGLLFFFNPAVVDWHDGRALLGNGLILAGAVSWALGACLYRRRRWRSAFWTQTFWQILASTIVIDLLALAFGRGGSVHWTPTLWAVLLYNWLFGVSLTYWWWGKALGQMPASQAGQIVSLVPVVALAMSAAALGEPVTASTAVSVALILAGIFVTLSAAARR